MTGLKNPDRETGNCLPGIWHHLTISIKSLPPKRIGHPLHRHRRSFQKAASEPASARLNQLPAMHLRTLSGDHDLVDTVGE